MGLALHQREYSVMVVEVAVAAAAVVAIMQKIYCIKTNNWQWNDALSKKKN